MIEASKTIPLILVVSGLCLGGAGLLYDVVFAGIPYPDPTPEMLASYDRHALVARVIELAGAADLALGLALLWLWPKRDAHGT